MLQAAVHISRKTFKPEISSHIQQLRKKRQDKRDGYCTGYRDDTYIEFSTTWRGYEFDEEECKCLLRGETLELHGIISKKRGITYAVLGKLEKLDDSQSRYGFTVTQFLRVELYKSWCKHVFTDEEKMLLTYGAEIFCDDCIGKNGDTFSVYLSYSMGLNKIIPRYPSSKDDSMPANNNKG